MYENTIVMKSKNIVIQKENSCGESNRESQREMNDKEDCQGFLGKMTNEDQ